MATATKYPILSTRSGHVSIDQFFMTQQNTIDLARQKIATDYGVNMEAVGYQFIEKTQAGEILRFWIEIDESGAPVDVP